MFAWRKPAELVREQPVNAGEHLKDPKTRLQEMLQARRLELPVYAVVEVTGKAHHQRFSVECRVEAMQKCARGEGSSRRGAEQATSP